MRRLGVAGIQFHQYQPYVAGRLGFTKFTEISFSADVLGAKFHSCHYLVYGCALASAKMHAHSFGYLSREYADLADTVARKLS